MNVETIKTKDIVAYENNPRKNINAIGKVKKSIQEFGIKQPLVIDKDNIIIVGHTRYQACVELGFKEVPCLRADDLSEEQAKAYRLADNKTNEFSEWDFELLEEEFNNIKNIDLNEYCM